MKALLSGAAISAVAGLLMGAVAKPDLLEDGRPAGPQMMAGWGAGRSTGPFDDGAAFAAYKGQLPDYVLGTDWKRAVNAPVYQPPPLEPPVKLARAEEPPPLPVTDAAYHDDGPAPQPSYPSLAGGQTYHADLLPPADEPG